MHKLIPLFLALCLNLLGCSQDLHFKIHFAETSGLSEGDPLVLNDQKIGEITAIEAAEDSGQLVSVAVDRAAASAATVESNFFLADDPTDPKRKRIEIVQTRPDGKPLAEGAIVEGSSPPGPLGSFPFAEILKEFSGALRNLREQVERFRQEFEKVPRSEAAQKLEQEWLRLMEEIRQAQSAAEGSWKKDLLPKLQKELEELRKRFDELQKNGEKNAKPLET